ncbi:hypothetical protein C0991_007043 [Blastosporella zonata]|nr:hypothetical protein C0991_007043 [Blastosporella zonata]
MPSQDLATQDSTFIEEYSAYYNLPKDLDHKEIIKLICSARSTVPILPHLTFDRLENGLIHFTGGLPASNGSEGNTKSRQPSVHVPASQNGPSAQIAPLGENVIPDSGGANIKVPAHRALTRGSHVYLAIREAEQRYAGRADENPFEVGEASESTFAPLHVAASGSNAPLAAGDPDVFPESGGANIKVPAHRALTRGSHEYIALQEARQRYAEFEAQSRSQVQESITVPIPPNVHTARGSNTPPAAADSDPDAIPGPSGAHIKVPSHRALTRGSHVFIAMREAGQRQAEREAENPSQAYESRGTAPVVPPRHQPATRRPTPPLERLLPMMWQVSSTQQATAPLLRRTAPPVVITSPQEEPATDFHDYSPVAPHQARVSLSPSGAEPWPRTPVDEDEDSQPLRPQVLIPFPTIEDSPASVTHPLPDEQRNSSPPAQARGPRFAYPPTIKGDWLDTMLNDVASGRTSLKTALEKAKEQVRLAVEAVMKAQMDVAEEVEQWDGFQQYLRLVIGEEWLEAVQRDARNMEEYGSDYVESDDESGDGNGNGAGGDYPKDGGKYADNGGSSPDDERDCSKDGDECPHYLGHYPSDGGNQGGDDGDDGGRGHRRDGHAWGWSDTGNNERQHNNSESAEYETPSRPRRNASFAVKRPRDSAQDEDAFTPIKRPKSSHRVDSSDRNSHGGNKDDDFPPCSMRPATPRSKRRRSESLDRQYEVVKEDGSYEDLDSQYTGHPHKKPRTGTFATHSSQNGHEDEITHPEGFPAPAENKDDDDFNHPSWTQEESEKDERGLHKSPQTAIRDLPLRRDGGLETVSIAPRSITTGECRAQLRSTHLSVLG